MKSETYLETELTEDQWSSYKLTRKIKEIGKLYVPLKRIKKKEKYSIDEVEQIISLTEAKRRKLILRKRAKPYTTIYSRKFDLDWNAYRLSDFISC